MKNLYKIFFLIPFLFSCVDLYDPGLKTGDKRLVVEAQLTTRSEYQYVFLTYDSGYNGDETNFKFLVKRAKIAITDDKGTVYEFYDELPQSNQIKTAEGYNYRSTNKFKAEVGRSYKLTVETLEGKKYESTFEKVLPVPTISKTYSEYKANLPPAKLAGNFNVFVDVKDPAETKNFYMWRSHSVKQINFCREWYIYGSGGATTIANIDNCCQPCYEKEVCEECFELGNDKFTNGKNISKQYVAQVPYLETKPYYMVISQYSLNETAYRYWSALKQQSKNSGGLFDATPQSLQGNIKSKTDDKEEVIGYFTVSDVSDQITYIERNLSGIKPNPYEEYSDFWVRTGVCFPCQETYKRSKFAPLGWRFQ
jgi:Domain of unknown function (DUF4249)